MAAIIHPRVDPMVAAYALAVLVGCYAGSLFIMLFSGEKALFAGDTLQFFWTALVAAAFVGTFTLPIVFVIGIPALLLAIYAVMRWNVASRWWFIGIGALCALGGAIFFQPFFTRSGPLDRSIFTLEALAIWAVFAPVGAISGWVFWRKGVRPAVERQV